VYRFHGKIVDGKLIFRWALAVGLIVRLVILWHTATLDTRIVDEQQYRQIGSSILAGYGFGWGPGQLTSIRPPLYPGLLAAVWAVAGSQNLQAVRALQIVLALATTGVVYLLGARIYNVTTGRYAAAICWLYPSFVFFNFLILTETLFTLLLVLFVLLTVMLVQAPRAATALACGIALGLATLTRSILWPLPVVLCPLLAILIRASWSRRLALPALVLVGYVVAVGPWAVRNTRLQQVVTIVDTMGGINLRMGNYEYTPDDRMWDAVALSGAKSWVYGLTPAQPGEVMTEGRKEKWAQRQAIEYMRTHPLTTARRSLIKFADFWGLEREFLAGVQGGLFAPARWFQILGSLVIVGAYVLVAAIGGVGLWVAAPRDWRMQVLLLLPLVVIVAGHTIVFGHSRYHMPLIPILAVYAAQLLVSRGPSLQMVSRAAWIGATATVTVFLAIWVRQVILVDWSRITALAHQIG
jgi:4-amino-4-deoxy-L-arabinose transferase-like glycosyltransferase